MSLGEGLAASGPRERIFRRWRCAHPRPRGVGLPGDGRGLPVRVEDRRFGDTGLYHRPLTPPPHPVPLPPAFRAPGSVSNDEEDHRVPPAPPAPVPLAAVPPAPVPHETDATASRRTAPLPESQGKGPTGSTTSVGAATGRFVPASSGIAREMNRFARIQKRSAPGSRTRRPDGEATRESRPPPLAGICDRGGKERLRAQGELPAGRGTRRGGGEGLE